VSSPLPRSNSPSAVQVRLDLSRAQQERAELQAKLDSATKELVTSRSKSKQDTKRITVMTSNVNQLTLKLRDREEELREKAKLIENVQDENVTLNLQLNMADEQQKKLKKENQDLVDRWMARMGKEADRMNSENRFG
jgi:chromosome segregation ATPase